MHQFMKRFSADASGNILIMTGLSIAFLFAVGGMGYDLGRQQLVKQRLQQASDAAVIAATGMEDGATVAQRTQMAQGIYALNFPDSYLGVARPAANIEVTATTVRVTPAATSIRTSFVSSIGVSTLAINATSAALIKSAASAPIDMMLVMDNSGSMDAADDFAAAGVPHLAGDFASMKQACRTLEDRGLRVNYDQLNYSCNSMSANDWHVTGKSRMNVLRKIVVDQSSQLLSAGLDNRVAVIKWISVLINSAPFSSNSTTVKADLMSMSANGYTDSTVGMQAAVARASTFRKDAVRAVVLLTDGENNDWWVDNPATLKLCSQLKKDHNAMVFTIAFGDGANKPETQQFLSDCATGPNGGAAGGKYPNQNTFYFVAKDGVTLAAAFNAITKTVQKARIVE